MKKNLLFGIPTVIGGLLLAIGTHTIFPVCGQSHHGGEHTVCFYSAQVIVPIGIIIVLTGLVTIFIKNIGLQKGLAISIALNAVMILLVANVLVGVHSDPHMNCNTQALPAWNIISSVILTLSILNLIYLAARGGKTDVKYKPSAGGGAHPDVV